MKSFQCVLQYALKCCLISIFIPACASVEQSQVIVSTNDPVGQVGINRFFTPTNQLLTPAGKLVELPGMRPQAIALFADGTRLITAGKTSEIVVVDPSSGEIIQRITLPAEDETHASANPVSPRLLKPDKNGQLSFTGLVVSPNGTRAYLANVDGSIKVFGIDDKGTISALFTFPLPHANAPRREAEIPSGIALSADGEKLYVCGNLSNHLLELDAKDGRVLRTWDVGVAPFDVVIAAGKAYVSNWGGRRPDAASLTGPAGRGTLVRVDPERFIASEGSV
ncbi:MAG: phosphoesterase, partial [Planctomycetes bacterium]|nr:phosphoesterase [Planctomycetota bacterium]